MKVETPQILWNSEAEKGKNAPLLSVDMIESGLASHAAAAAVAASSRQPQPQEERSEYSHVLVTAGNATSINLWKVNFGGGENAGTPSLPSTSSSDSIFQKQARPTINQIDFMLSLSRHDLAVNAVKFSPDGLHLVTAGDSGNLVLWSVPIHKRGNNNGRHYWSEITKESDLSVRIVSTHCEGVVDLSWSADSKRFAVGTIDSCLLIYEDKNHGMNACSPETHQKESDWQLVFRNGEHGSFVQGVSYDPLGVYVASMGGDRTVRVFPRKVPPKSKKKVLMPAAANNKNNNTLEAAATATGNHNSIIVTPPPQEHQRMVAQILTDSKAEVGKTKRIKTRSITVDDATGQQIKQKLFVDESNCESFFRRLSWTTDGAFLVTPAALWHSEKDAKKVEDGDNSGDAPSFSTYLFARHRFDEPYKVLPGLDKPSVVVRPNPVLFELPNMDALGPDATKENQAPADGQLVLNTSPCGLPYRSIFAVLTLDSVLVYDTHHSQPLAVIQGLHYAGLTDCCWSQDGMNLMVSSSDGYISIINFAAGELGKAYTPPEAEASSNSNTQVNAVIAQVEMGPPVELPPLPPCENEGEPTALEGRPTKKKRISPTLVSTLESASTPVAPSTKPDASTTTASPPTSTTSASKTMSASKRGLADTEKEIVPDVTRLSLDGITRNTSTTIPVTAKASGGTEAGGNAKKKQKKRIQPVLLSAVNP